MSEYKVKLSGWAWDRAVDLVKANIVHVDGVAATRALAEEIAGLFYQAEKDFEDAAKYLSELIQKSEDPLEKIKFLQDELAYAEEQFNRQKVEVIQ